MNYPQTPTFNTQANELQEEAQKGFITRVYGWMAIGLVITALVAAFTFGTESLLMAIITNRFLFFGLLIGELVVVAVLSGLVNKLSPTVAALLFVGYAVLNGVTLSILMLVYTETSIAAAFGITACTFGIMTLWGYTTHRDLTKAGSLLMMALLGLVIASVVNLFLNSEALYWIISYVGVVIFVGLIAYDTQRLKQMSLSLGSDGELMQKASIIGALKLYLDFINLFLMLLRVIGRRR